MDTAQIYGNEAEVGEAIANSGVARGDIFLTTKVWVENYGHDAFIKSVDESLKKLKTDYVVCFCCTGRMKRFRLPSRSAR